MSTKVRGRLMVPIASDQLARIAEGWLARFRHADRDGIFPPAGSARPQYHAAGMNKQVALDTENASTPQASSARSLEPALEELDSKLHELAAHVARLTKGMRRAQEGARLGHVKDLPKALAEVESAAAAAAETAHQLSWEFDARRWLGGGGYAKEV